MTACTRPNALAATGLPEPNYAIHTARVMAAPTESPHGEVRFGLALRWLLAQAPARPLLVLAPTLDAGNDLLRAATKQKGALFGWALGSLGSLAGRLSALPLAQQGLTLAPPLALEAVCVRVVAELASEGKLGRLSPIADRPGLPGALLRTFSELRTADVEPGAVGDSELAALYARYVETLAKLRLADRATVFRAAIEAARVSSTPPVGLPLCAYDLVLKTRLERTFLEALSARAPSTFATCPSSERSLATEPEPSSSAAASTEPESAPPALRRLQASLFSSNDTAGAADESVVILSAPGESRESVEIARRILAEAERGVPFDRMAVLLRSPFHYRTHLLEALRRAAIPAHFTRQAARPEPGGRAFLVLLECAAEGISATRFAEYLSLGVVPERAEAPDAEAALQAPTDEVSASLLRAPPAQQPAEPAPRAKDFSFPRRWESLLVDAAVIGGAARWHRRLGELTRALETKAQSANESDQRAAEQQLDALRQLSAFALPIVDRLGMLPQSEPWGAWLDALRTLANLTIARPEPILSVLGELEIVRDVGPVGLKDVLAVLRERLGQVTAPPSAAQGGAVLVASVDEARGRVFDVVFVPGLAEKLFPQRVVEDPLLPDTARARISPDLDQQAQRVASERAALTLAVGAAKKRVVLSYPRFESDKARPRVPSFYALEAIRAAEGRLPGFAELARRADEASHTRMGWPAPEHAADAIDAAEYDLSALRVLLTGALKDADGAAHYLLTSSARLRRALQFRARRWRPEWRYVDGLVEPNGFAREALSARHARLTERGFAVTALEKYAACPYRFYLSTVVGLSARKVSSAIEELDAPTRGLLIHELLRVASEALHQRGLFSNDTDFLHAKRVLLESINEQAATWREKLAPAIPRVWDDAILEIGADLVRWLQATRETGWEPVQFERAFGQAGPDTQHSKDAPGPVLLPFGLPLRGAIDAIDKSGNHLRATDYKTGAAPDTALVVGGGRHLQPALYALVLEQLFPEHTVAGGNAFYCTTRGGFERNEVALGNGSRAAAEAVHRTIAAAFQDGFFPAAPAEEACEHCDFRRICGPYERERVERKDSTRLEPLLKLRALP